MSFDSVELIHTQLECLKYVGGTKKDGTPTGQGIDVSIALLPDLLLDFRAHKVKKGGKKCAVGGRAARMACVLLHLLDDDDGTFSVRLLAKTGALGRLLVENQFSGRPVQRSLESCLEHVVLREGEPRCAYRTAEKKPTESSEATDKGELCAMDLEGTAALETILHARTVCLSSLKTPDFRGLFSQLLERKDETPCHLFLDAARAKHEGMENLKAALKNTPPSKIGKRLALFVPGDQKEEFLSTFGIKAGPSAVEQFCRTYGVSVVQYDASGDVSYTPADNGKAITVSCPHDFLKDGTPEGFKAGVLLASSVSRTLVDVKKTFPDLYKCLVGQWPKVPDGGHWKCILDYGVRMAEVARKANWSVRQLVGEDSIHFSKDRESVRPVHFYDSEGVGKLALRGADTNTFAGLAGLRRKKRGLLHKELPLCNSCEKKCLSGPGTASRAKTAVLIDLDATLLDSTEQRKRGLVVALDTITDDLNRHGVTPSPVDFFTDNVYNLWPVYKGLGLGDFRQEWNHMGWYATYILLARDEKLRKTVVQWWHDRGRRRKGATVETPEEAPWCEDFLTRYREVHDKYGDLIRRAMSSFSSVKMRPFKEARDFLQSLKSTGAFELYVVSEGHPDTQWRKIESTGLSDFFDRQHVLTTGDAAEPIKERQELMNETTCLKERQENLTHQRKHTWAWLRELSDVENSVKLIHDDPKMIEVFGPRSADLLTQVAQLDQKKTTAAARLETAAFVDNVLTRMAHKLDVAFYAAAVRAILRNPRYPLDELRSFAHLIDGSKPKTRMKFAMIGDRQTNDIEPPTKLLKREHLLTIRLVSGRYAVEEPPEKAYDHPPTFVAHTLAQAKAIFLSAGPWRDIVCATDPPVFNWKVNIAKRQYLPSDERDDTIGLDHVTCGIEMPTPTFHIINTICSGILVEHLARCDAHDREAILMPYLNEHGGKDRKARIRGLCAIVKTGAMTMPVFIAYARSFVERLSQDLDSLIAEKGHAGPDIHHAVTSLQRLGTQGTSESKKLAKQELAKLGEKWGVV